MDFAPGGELFERLVDGPFDEASAILVARNILQAVAHVHEQGIIHRDIKPENILLRSPGGTDVLLADFGLAIKAEQANSLSGTLQYMAPEVRDGNTESIKSISCTLRFSQPIIVMFCALTSPGALQALHQGRRHVERGCCPLHHLARVPAFPGKLRTKL